jgi:hypothetical protein
MYRTALLCATLLLAATAVHAQTVRVRGTITGLQGDELAVKTREGRDVEVELTKDASVSYPKTVNLTDIKPGTPLGTTAKPGPDGKLVASEVHVFPGATAPNEGHRPMADQPPGTTMTNATVSAAGVATGGRELTLSYKGGTQTVIVPDNTPVLTQVPADRSYLKGGEYVSLAASMNNDGKLVASRVQVSHDGVRPVN